MTRKDRVRSEMLLRVRDFGTAHRDLFPESSEGVQALAAVTAAVDMIEVNAVKKLLTARDGQEAVVGARALVVDRMLVIAQTAKGILRLVTSDPTLRMPRQKSSSALLTAARTFIADAENDRDRLTRLGMPPTGVSDLAEAVASLEKAIAARAEGRAQAKGAQQAIDRAIADGFAAVRTLDVVVANATRQDPVLFAQWAEHRRVSWGHHAASEPAAHAADVSASAGSNDPHKKAS